VYASTDEEIELIERILQEYIEDNWLRLANGEITLEQLLNVDEMSLRWDERDGWTLAPKGTTDMHQTKSSNARGLFCSRLYHVLCLIPAVAG